jgi:hypothetical protein
VISLKPINTDSSEVRIRGNRNGNAFYAIRNGLRVRAGTDPTETIIGEVVLALTFNVDGEIVDSRVVSGPDPLGRPALQTALSQNDDAATARTVQVIVEFTDPPAGGRGGRGREDVEASFRQVAPGNR